jgi:hypothetical protein
MIVASLVIAALIVVILTMGALMHQQAEKIHALKAELRMADDALTDALEGKRPEMFLESSGLDVIIKKQKPKPWEGFADDVLR